MTTANENTTTPEAPVVYDDRSIRGGDQPMVDGGDQPMFESEDRSILAEDQSVNDKNRSTRAHDRSMIEVEYQSAHAHDRSMRGKENRSMRDKENRWMHGNGNRSMRGIENRPMLVTSNDQPFYRDCPPVILGNTSLESEN